MLIFHVHKDLDKLRFAHRNVNYFVNFVLSPYGHNYFNRFVTEKICIEDLDISIDERCSNFR